MTCPGPKDATRITSDSCLVDVCRECWRPLAECDLERLREAVRAYLHAEDTADPHRLERTDEERAALAVMRAMTAENGGDRG